MQYVKRFCFKGANSLILRSKVKHISFVLISKCHRTIMKYPPAEPKIQQIWFKIRILYSKNTTIYFAKLYIAILSLKFLVATFSWYFTYFHEYQLSNYLFLGSTLHITYYCCTLALSNLLHSYHFLHTQPFDSFLFCTYLIFFYNSARFTSPISLFHRPPYYYKLINNLLYIK